jgi:Zn-dependent peptidase ImmA (M78 family)
MRYRELISEAKTTEQEFLGIMKDFLPFAMEELQLKILPKFKLMTHIPNEGQPTFGRYENEENVIYLALDQRHPLDVARTLAHELVHFKQGTEHRLDDTSGHTGSPEENEAHELAGIIMRNFNKQHPEYFEEPAIQLKNTLP